MASSIWPLILELKFSLAKCFYLKTNVSATLQQPLSMFVQKLQTLNTNQTKSTVMGQQLYGLHCYDRWSYTSGKVPLSLLREEGYLDSLER